MTPKAAAVEAGKKDEARSGRVDQEQGNTRKRNKVNVSSSSAYTETLRHDRGMRRFTEGSHISQPL